MSHVIGAGLHLEAQVGDAGVGLFLDLDAQRLGGGLEQRLALALLVGAAERDDGELLRLAPSAANMPTRASSAARDDANDVW